MLISITKFKIQSLNFTQNFQQLVLYSTSTLKANSSIQSFSNYLVNSLGLSPQQAISTCTKLSIKKVNEFKFSNNAISVINFLKKHGFSDTNVKKIVSLYPKMLCMKVDKTLKPKFKILKDEGLSESDINRIVLMNPGLIHCGMESCVLPLIKVLREIMCNDYDVVVAITKLHWREVGYVSKNLFPNVSLLRKNGVSIEVIRKQLLWEPSTLSKSHEYFEDVVNKIEKRFGIPCDSSRYMYVVHLLCGYNEAIIESKCRLFKSFGWTQEDIETMLVKNTCCFTLSDGTMKKKLEFLVTELGLEPAYVMSHSALLTCSLEKRLVPRYEILMILKEKHLMRKIPGFYSTVCMPESHFVEVFVLPYNEVHEVYAKHIGCNLKILTEKRKVKFS